MHSARASICRALALPCLLLCHSVTHLAVGISPSLFHLTDRQSAICCLSLCCGMHVLLLLSVCYVLQAVGSGWVWVPTTVWTPLQTWVMCTAATVSCAAPATTQ